MRRDFRRRHLTNSLSAAPQAIFTDDVTSGGEQAKETQSGAVDCRRALRCSGTARDKHGGGHRQGNYTRRHSVNFYRAMLCIRGTSHGPVSVCLSVTSRSSTKTDKRRIIQITPHDSPGTLVFWCQRSPRNSTGVTPYEGAECRWGGSQSATFD